VLRPRTTSPACSRAALAEIFSRTGIQTDGSMPFPVLDDQLESQVSDLLL
jgi:hypothetical protein